MKVAHERVYDQGLSVQDALIVLNEPLSSRSREVTGQDLPDTFDMPADILEYGDMLTKNGLKLLRETGKHTEALFILAIDKDTSEFIRVTAASDPHNSILDTDGKGVFGVRPGVRFRDAKLPILKRALGTFIRRGKIAHIFAAEAHTHPSEQTVTINGVDPVIGERLALPLMVAPPSRPDIQKLGMWSLANLVFSPGGLAFMTVPTDRTPKIKVKGSEPEEYDPWLKEDRALRNDYMVMLRDKSLSPRLEMVLRQMYPDGANSPALDLWQRNQKELILGDPRTAWFNPVVFPQILRIKAQVESLYAVGYYCLPGSNTFIRFTD